MRQLKKFERFKALHEREEAFVLPNPWDTGTARILASLGFEALATTSAGYGFTVGKGNSDGGFSRAEILENSREIVEATDLPVSADLEDGFGEQPEACAAVNKPVNVFMGLSGPTFSVQELQAAGVKRVSVGGSFARAALAGFVNAATEVRDQGRFTYARSALPGKTATRLISRRD